MEEKFKERLPITEWPEIERKMGIISRMTSDPPLKTLQEEPRENESPEYNG